MSAWNKKSISKESVEKLQKKYNLDPITSSIFCRRNITDGKELLYYLEDELRFQNNPFLFSNMEDVVDRILSAKEENEKVLIFGDRDVDGVTATTVLYDCLSEMGIDVRFRLPAGDDAYGLSMQAVDDFSKEFGSLIITVDCGISNNVEIAHAAELGMDVIIADHHNAPEILPSPALIIDPKVENSGYPFKDISGCAVVYKIVSALRFSQTKWYKEDLCLLNVEQEQSGLTVECLKVRNNIPVSRLVETFSETVAFTKTKTASYLQGQLLLVWDKKLTENLLSGCFGSGVEFNLLEIKKEVEIFFPSIASLPLAKIKDMSKLAKYGNHNPTEIGGFYNIFVTYVQQVQKKQFPKYAEQEIKDLQLVALAALADIMPMKNENRIFVRNGIASINSGKIRPGLLELMSKLNLLTKRVNSTDLGWVVVSNLNAAGRLGQPELAANLFLEKDPAKREAAAEKIIELNTQRKQLSLDAWKYAQVQSQTSVQNYGNKLCVVIDERINRGVSGILAGKLVSTYNVPSIAVTFVGDTAIGSMRSCRDFDSTEFLNKMSDIFINHGGHKFAAGFSFERSRLNEFEAKLKALSSDIQLTNLADDSVEIDAEIPQEWLTENLLAISDLFEPYGEENKSLLFMSKNMLVRDAFILGKGEKQHLKFIIDTGKNKWPCLFWNEGERLHRDFEIGDRVDILYKVERNTYNGVENVQLVISDLRRSENW